VQRRCGLSFGGDGGLYRRLSALKNLRLLGPMYDMHGKALRSRAGQMLEAAAPADSASGQVETFSRGMRQPLHIACAVMGDGCSSRGLRTPMMGRTVPG
jgi:ABC-2 type transport system ATP-binding protein